MITPSRQPEFDALSSTGQHFMLYRAVGLCECMPKDEELFNEPDPTHKECFGTGIKREPILTEKVRYQYSAVTKTSNLEIQFFERIKDNLITIYFPYYMKPGYKDIICSLKHDGKNNVIRPMEIDYVYRVLSVDEFIENNFKFYSVKAAKLQYAPFEGNIK